MLPVDADEFVTPALADEIRATLARTPPEAGFRIPRITWHLGRWIRATDWYPDYQLRLYDRRRAAWKPRPVHQSVEVTGGAGYLRHDLQHYAYRDIAHHHATMDRYTTLAAAHMHDKGRRAGVFDLTVHPAAAFLRNYVLRRGFTQGTPGLIISAMNAYYVFLKFAKLREMRIAQARLLAGPAGAERHPGAPAVRQAQDVPSESTDASGRARGSGGHSPPAKDEVPPRV